MSKIVNNSTKIHKNTKKSTILQKIQQKYRKLQKNTKKSTKIQKN